MSVRNDFLNAYKSTDFFPSQQVVKIKPNNNIEEIKEFNSFGECLIQYMSMVRMDNSYVIACTNPSFFTPTDYSKDLITPWFLGYDEKEGLVCFKTEKNLPYFYDYFYMDFDHKTHVSKAIISEKFVFTPDIVKEEANSKNKWYICSNPNDIIKFTSQLESFGEFLGIGEVLCWINSEIKTDAIESFSDYLILPIDLSGLSYTKKIDGEKHFLHPDFVIHYNLNHTILANIKITIDESNPIVINFTSSGPYTLSSYDNFTIYKVYKKKDFIDYWESQGYTVELNNN